MRLNDDRHAYRFALLMLVPLAMLLYSCAATPPAGPPPQLSGTRWAVTSVDGAVPGRGADLTADFGVDGRINGDSGCNNFSGPYIQTGATVQIGELLSTRRACTDNERQQQETRMLRVLQGVNTVERGRDGRINLRGDSGSVTLAPLSSDAMASRRGRMVLDCQGVALTVVFDGDEAAITWSGGHDELEQRPSSSGAYYESSGNSLRVGGDNYTWTRQGAAPRKCEELR